ncbi:RepB family protein [Aminipila sp.]|uniref:RepB family protein n=1 Tax=Aminipila sp. TaxID=2060095 RepID=UPI00289655CF|nr:RepB family protein [Aminipila sp.]
MAKDKVKKDADIHIRISTENKSQLEEICEAEKRSQSQQIEYWITQYFARRR